MYLTIRVRCPWCDKSHEAPFHLAGQKFRCKKCSGVIKIPGEPVAGLELPASPAPAPPARAVSTRSRKRAEPPPPSVDLFDLDDEPVAPPRPPTLREMEDGTYDPGPLPERATVGLPPREEVPGKKRKKRRGSGEDSSTWEKVQTGLLVLGLVGCLLILGLGLFVPGGRAIAVLLSFVAGLGMMAVGGIWSVCIPFQESTRCGLMYLFVPFYAGYYTKTRFSEMFTPFMVNILGVFLVYMATLGPLNQFDDEPLAGAHPAATDPESDDAQEWFDEDEEFEPAADDRFPMPRDAVESPAPPQPLPTGLRGRRGPEDQ